MPREPHSASQLHSSAAERADKHPLAMLHPSCWSQAISRDGPRLNHAEAASKLLRSRLNRRQLSKAGRFRRQPYLLPMINEAFFVLAEGMPAPPKLTRA